MALLEMRVGRNDPALNEYKKNNIDSCHYHVGSSPRLWGTHFYFILLVVDVLV